MKSRNMVRGLLLFYIRFYLKGSAKESPNTMFELSTRASFTTTQISLEIDASDRQS